MEVFKIVPNEAASLVRVHVQEHVVNEQAAAKEEGKKVVSQNVQIHTSVCPECGITYVSGGLTTTTVQESDSTQFNEYEAGKQSEGVLVDYRL